MNNMLKTFYFIFSPGDNVVASTLQEKLEAVQSTTELLFICCMLVELCKTKSICDSFSTILKTILNLQLDKLKKYMLRSHSVG